MAVDRIEKLFHVDLYDGSFVAPLHPGDPHVVLHIQRGPDGPFPVKTRIGAVYKYGPVDVLQGFMDGSLHDLVPELRNVEAALFWLRDRPVTIGARDILLLSLIWVWPRFDRRELTP